MTKEIFIEKIAKYVCKYAPDYDILCPSAVIAQAILESGWGESALAARYHNYFGLKCGTLWKGKSVNLETQEEYSPGTLSTITDNFRVYGSMEDGVKGYFEFIQLDRYKNLKGIREPDLYLSTIKDDGYATSSTYKQSCMDIVESYGLRKYDPMRTDDPIENACLWMENLAMDDSHGYDQRYRWGENGDYDCSSAVITAWERAGIPVKTNGATFTGNMKKAFTGSGFVDITSRINLATGEGLIRGDVLLNEANHTAMYAGNGKEIEASINERGNIVGGIPGDQTGKEVFIGDYRNYPWDCVLRYMPIPEVSTQNRSRYGYVRKGSKGNKVRLLQFSLNMIIGVKLDVDGEFGDETLNALKRYQNKKSLPCSGCVDMWTWAALSDDLARKMVD